MKNLIVKFGGYIALSTILLSFQLPTTLAKDFSEITKAVDGLEECVKTSEYQDYVVTIVEESFIDPVKESGTNPGDNFFIVTCYRNTIRYMETTGLTDSGNPKGEEIVVSKLATLCNPAGIELEKTFKAEKLRYYCEEVQVIYSKGGTTLLEGYIGLIYRYAATIVGVIAVLIIILSGIQISASGGDQEAVTKAKDRILKSIAGIAVLFLSGIILYTINPTFFIR